VRSPVIALLMPSAPLCLAVWGMYGLNPRAFFSYTPVFVTKRRFLAVEHRLWEMALRFLWYIQPNQECEWWGRERRSFNCLYLVPWRRIFAASKKAKICQCGCWKIRGL